MGVQQQREEDEEKKNQSLERKRIEKKIIRLPTNIHTCNYPATQPFFFLLFLLLSRFGTCASSTAHRKGTHPRNYTCYGPRCPLKKIPRSEARDVWGCGHVWIAGCSRSFRADAIWGGFGWSPDRLCGCPIMVLVCCVVSCSGP